MKSVTLSSCYNYTSGYNTLLMALLKYLPCNNMIVRPRSFSNVTDEFLPFFENIQYIKEQCDLALFPAVSSLNNTNPLFHLNAHKCRILFTMWESSRIGDIFIDILNKNTSIIVPNLWNQKNFYNQGCEVPIHVVPLFIDTNIFNYTQPNNNDIFVFGIANNDPRKRLYETVKCFLKAFPREKNVKLSIKTNNSNMRFLDNRIEIVNQHLSVMELKKWYTNLDVFVSGVSAEGWGFMQHESMACGRPVLAAPYAGLAEFMNPSNSFCINYKEVSSTGYWESAGGKWSMFDEDHMIETMRYAYMNRDIVRNKGWIASQDVKKLNIVNFIDNIVNILNMY